MKILKIKPFFHTDLLNKAGFPANSFAKYACLLVKRAYLLDEELFILQKMGFTIEETECWDFSKEK